MRIVLGIVLLALMPAGKAKRDDEAASSAAARRVKNGGDSTVPGDRIEPMLSCCLNCP